MFVLRLFPVFLSSLPDYVKDQCETPVASFEAGGGTQILSLYEGKCVSVCWNDRWNNIQSVNVIVGGDLPDPGNCSSVAASRNVPTGWDFTANGYCGKGKSGDNMWRDCLVHDTCVWANCMHDDEVPGGVPFAPDGPGSDKDCGNEYNSAVDDWVAGNIWGCIRDSQCPSGRCAWTIKAGLQCQSKLGSGHWCEQDSDCISGRCSWTANAGLKCQDKLENGNWCEQDSDCASGRCAWKNTKLQCLEKLNAGAICEENSDCTSGSCTWSTIIKKCK